MNKNKIDRFAYDSEIDRFAYDSEIGLSLQKSKSDEINKINTMLDNLLEIIKDLKNKISNL